MVWSRAAEYCYRFSFSCYTSRHPFGHRLPHWHDIIMVVVSLSTYTLLHVHSDCVFYRTPGFHLQHECRKSTLPALLINSDLHIFSGVGMLLLLPDVLHSSCSLRISRYHNKFQPTLQHLHEEKKMCTCFSTRLSQCSYKAIYSSYQCNSLREAASGSMQLSTIKSNIINTLFHGLLLHSHLTDTIHGRLSFCPEHTGGIAAFIPPVSLPSHHQLTCRSRGVISPWSLLHLINSHLQTAASVHFWV